MQKATLHALCVKLALQAGNGFHSARNYAKRWPIDRGHGKLLVQEALDFALRERNSKHGARGQPIH
jgi:hypothetical protein